VCSLTLAFNRAAEQAEKKEKEATEAKSEQILSSGAGDERGPLGTLTILYFSDACNLESRAANPVGGAARFASLIDKYEAKGLRPLVLFGGDTFSPSASKSLG
jgi:2',3'-cyclic-nucleotide 2'-phosphodiesterase (5'-nucleotidase family)